MVLLGGSSEKEEKKEELVMGWGGGGGRGEAVCNKKQGNNPMKEHPRNKTRAEPIQICNHYWKPSLPSYHISR